MKTRFTVDVSTGAISRSISGVAVPSAQVGALFARDVLDCEVVFKAGATDVTADVLSGTRQLKLGLRQLPNSGDLLAVSEPHALVDDVAQCVFSLDTVEIVALIAELAASVRSARVYFEVEVSEIDGSYRQTFAQQQFTLNCEVNMEGDEPTPAEPGFYTKTEIDELLAPTNGAYRLKDGFLQLKDQTSGNWRKAWLNAGALTLSEEIAP